MLHALLAGLLQWARLPLRLLESAADETGRLHAWSGATDIFITPGYRFKAVDVLMTNFTCRSRRFSCWSVRFAAWM
jgi:hypothetical protein